MKSKKRHHSSSDDSENSDDSLKSSSSSDSDSDGESSMSEHRYKRKKKRAASSESESETENHKRSKKRKHKKKKKKHIKKKRRSDPAVVHNLSDLEEFTMSEGEVSPKKKRKHKRKHKRARSASVSEIDEEKIQHRQLHSVVKERISSPERKAPVRTYYQKEYQRSRSSPDDYTREQEVQRFYRGSSKSDRGQYQPEYHQYGHENNRNTRFEHQSQKPMEDDYRRKPREDVYHSREEPRGFNRYNNQEREGRGYEDRGSRKREYVEIRDYRERRGHPEQERYRERDFHEKKERYRDEPFQHERPRDFRRERLPGRPDRPPPPPHNRNQLRSRSPEERFKEHIKRPEYRDEREERYRPRDDERPDRNERPERIERLERPERNERPERLERPERPERPERAERIERSERPERPERVERLEKPERRDERPRPDVKQEFKLKDKKTRFGDTDEKDYTWGKTTVKKEDGKPTEEDKEKPNFGLSGKLTEEANTVNGVVIKYSEPDDAKQPKRRWRFYPFKGDKALPILYIHRQSAFLIGRDKKVVDIALEHPSVSKQHAALQFRATPFTRPDGSQGRRVRPYVIDLDSANGTCVNNKKIEPRRYVELLERDVVKFGFSQRDYVLLHENSKDDAQDDDQPDAPVTTADQIKQEKRVKLELAEDGD